MNIVLQIKSLGFSFLFGLGFATTISFFYRLLYHKRVIIQIFTSLFLVLIGVFVYFLGLKQINNAIFHIYEIFGIIVGYSLETIISGKIAKRKKR